MNIPQSTKIIDLSQSRVYSAQDIQHQVTLVKNWASALGTKRIGIAAKNSFDFAVAWLGIRQTSCVTVLINYKLPLAQLESCLRSCDLVLTDTDLSTDVPSLHISQCRSTDPAPLPRLDPERDSLILYTSGSTGTPNAVVYSYQDIEHHARGSYKYMPPDLRTICGHPFFHLAGLFWLNHNINQGNQLFLMNTFDAAIMSSAITRYQIHVVTAVPPVIERLLRHIDPEQTFDSVVAMNLPSAQLGPETITQIKKHFPALIYFKNPYGLTETGISVFQEHDNLPTPTGSVGVAGDLEIQLIDSVLYIRTKHLKSQLKHSEKDWFCTGDRFDVDQNGFYYYLGRADNMFKVNGEKVYPEHVESVLYKVLKNCAVCVVGMPHEITGHKVIAVIELLANHDQDQLIQHCAKHLAAYQIPSQFVSINELPLTPSGKIDRKQVYTYIKDHVTSTH